MKHSFTCYFVALALGLFPLTSWAETSSGGPAPASDSKATTPAPADTSKAAPTASAPAASVKPPRLSGKAGEVQTYVESLFETSKGVNSTDAAEKNKARAKIETAVDWEAISHECLGKANWKKASAANRAEFEKLLKDVILRTAYSRLDKFWTGTTYSVPKVDLTGSSAHVPAKFVADGEEMSLDYYFREKKHKWLLYDISFEGTRYSSNISEQIDSFLAQGNFKQLIEKLKKRREELISDADSSSRR